MKSKLLFALLLIAQAGYSQNLFTKGISKLAKVMGTANAVTSADLSEVTPTVGISSNLHPSELGTISQSFFNGWVSGGNLTYLMFSKKSTPGYVKIDGSVTIDGTPVEYLTSGMYGFITPASTTPGHVEIATSTGQKASFNIKPYKNPVKIISVNGQSDNISLDLTKDVTIELEGADVAAGKPLKVMIAVNQVSIKSLYDVCYIRSGSKITIPAAAFRNINIVPGGNAIYNYKKSFISVGFESVENATDVTGAFSEVKYISGYTDGKFITVTNEPQLNTGLVAKGSAEFAAGAMDYSFFKPGAFTSRPISQLSKIGVISFAIRGTTYQQHETESQFALKTQTLEFPQQSNETWDALLEKMYPEFMAVIQSQLAPVMPVESITATQAYKSAESFARDDVNTKVAFSRSYKSTKVISAFMPVSEGYGVNSTNEKIMKESGANGLLTMTIDLQMETDKEGHILMCPKLAFEISGASNGTVANTKYYSGTVTGKGVPFNDQMAKNELEKVIRASDLVAAFEKGLKEIREKEKANNDYQAVWDLQK
jgi:hypothetical protein